MVRAPSELALFGVLGKGRSSQNWDFFLWSPVEMASFEIPQESPVRAHGLSPVSLSHIMGVLHPLSPDSTPGFHRIPQISPAFIRRRPGGQSFPATEPSRYFRGSP